MDCRSWGAGRLIEGCIPTEAMVAHVLVARYADHLPLCRQAQILERQGVIIERSTLSFWALTGSGVIAAMPMWCAKSWPLTLGDVADYVPAASADVPKDSQRSVNKVYKSRVV